MVLVHMVLIGLFGRLLVTLQLKAKSAVADTGNLLVSQSGSRDESYSLQRIVLGSLIILGYHQDKWLHIDSICPWTRCSQTVGNLQGRSLGHMVLPGNQSAHIRYQTRFYIHPWLLSTLLEGLAIHMHSSNTGIRGRGYQLRIVPWFRALQSM